MSHDDREKQRAQAEEILGDRLQQASFVKGLFFGQYLQEQLPPYPPLAADDPAGQLVNSLRDYCRENIDPVAIDRNSCIPDEVVRGLVQLGVTGG